jgi:hypothetical protein
MSKVWQPIMAPPSGLGPHSHAPNPNGNPNGNNYTNHNSNNNTNAGNGGASLAGAHSITRTVLVHIAGNRASWEHLGMHGALWQVNPERAAAIFSEGYVADSDAGAFAERLGRAMIRSVTLLESNTNVDETVSVAIDGLPPREFTRNGEGASLFLTGEGRITQPQVLFNMSGNTELGLQWMQQYPRYTNDNLHDEGVIFLTGASYYFVHEGHPVIHFLRANEEQLGVTICSEPLLEGGWIRVDIDTFTYCVRSLRETVLKYTPSTFNLANLTVRIAKPDGQRWMQLCPQLINSLLSDEVRESDDADLITEARRLAVQRYFDRPLFVTLRLAIEYALPEVASAANATPPPPPSASAMLAGASSSSAVKSRA